jgi:phosphoribosylglycinamide formyltransferase-1
MLSEDKTRIAIFASGTGSNAEQICAYFHGHSDIRVSLILTNKADAGVLQVALRHGIEALWISKKNWSDPEVVMRVLEANRITHIVLAGFLLLLPVWLIQPYAGRIINIHPSLLPRHGGKGKYGHSVHESVKAAGDLVSGITIHEVNERYDEGKIIFQQEIGLETDETPDEIARKVLRLEHHFYPRVIEDWILSHSSGNR